jgi:hypothetical protein
MTPAAKIVFTIINSKIFENTFSRVLFSTTTTSGVVAAEITVSAPDEN